VKIRVLSWRRIPAPTLAAFEFVVADNDGKRQLITRDAQHEYVFVEEASAAKP